MIQQAGLKPGKKLVKQSSTVSIFLILVVMCALMAAVSPAFVKISNILSTARSFSAIAVAGIGVSMVIITGGIDLSIGSVYGLAGVISAMLVEFVSVGILASVVAIIFTNVAAYYLAHLVLKVDYQFNAWLTLEAVMAAIVLVPLAAWLVARHQFNQPPRALLQSI